MWQQTDHVISSHSEAQNIREKEEKDERKLGLVGDIIQQLLFDKGYITTKAI